MWKPGPAHNATTSRWNLGGDLGHRHNGAKGDEPIRQRIAVGEQLRARARADAVGTDQCRACEAAAVLGGHRDPIAEVLERVTMASGSSVDQWICAGKRRAATLCRSMRWMMM